MAVPVQGTAPPLDSAEGTGAIDPKILALDPVPLMEAMPRDVQDLPTTLPQQVRAVGDVRLPAAVGGTGLPSGQGPGNGQGAPKGSGWGIIRGVPGMNQGLNLNDLEAVHEEIPVYPMLAEWGHIQGDVVVRVTINEKGVPIRTELLEGPPMLRAETLRAVKRWRFGTGIFRGRKVNAVFDMTFRYTLRTR